MPPGTREHDRNEELTKAREEAEKDTKNVPPHVDPEAIRPEPEPAPEEPELAELKKVDSTIPPP